MSILSRVRVTLAIGFLGLLLGGLTFGVLYAALGGIVGGMLILGALGILQIPMLLILRRKLRCHDGDKLE
jgi:hypothetical protein